jgi:hypothetical protein
MAAIKKSTAKPSKASAEKGKPRELEIQRAKQTGMYMVRFKGGGELPDSLKEQWFTGIGVAQRAIDLYLDAK